MIQAKIVADSINIQGDRLTTLEVIMPRYILAESKTHRVVSGMLHQVTIEEAIGFNDEESFSKNSASSRAIPLNKMIKEVQDNPFIPYAWQLDHKGMQGTEYLENSHLIEKATRLWLKARDNAVMSATLLNGSVGGKAVTKQLANRLLEPFMYHKVLVSATEFKNFFNLRCPSYEWEYEEGTIKAKSKEEFLNMFLKRYPTNGEKDLIDELGLVDEDLQPINILAWLNLNKGQADIHMMFLAEAIYDAIKESTPKELKEGEWHIPYGDNMNIQTLNNYLINTDLGKTDTIETLQCKISIARCARLSYQTLGDNPVIDYEADLKLYDNLYKSKHASPTEHIAKAMTEEEYSTFVKQEGSIVHKGWCRNFRGFRQWREISNL